MTAEIMVDGKTYPLKPGETAQIFVQYGRRYYDDYRLVLEALGRGEGVKITPVKMTARGLVPTAIENVSSVKVGPEGKKLAADEELRRVRVKRNGLLLGDSERAIDTNPEKPIIIRGT